MNKNIVEFPGNNPFLGKPKEKAEEVPGDASVDDVCIAIAYYVQTDQQAKAQAILNYLRAHSPIPKAFNMPRDIAELVGAADWGEAMFPSCT